MRLSTFVLRGVQRAAPGIPTWSAEYDDEPCGVQRTCFWISGLLSGMHVSIYFHWCLDLVLMLDGDVICQSPGMGVRDVIVSTFAVPKLVQNLQPVCKVLWNKSLQR